MYGIFNLFNNKNNMFLKLDFKLVWKIENV